MKTYKGLRGILAALGLLLLATTAHAEPRLAITPLGLQITQLQEVPGNPRAVDVTARTAVINRGDAAIAVRATLVSSSPKFIVLDGELFFGDVPRTSLLRPVLSQDTFKLRITLPTSRKPSALLSLLLEINESLDWHLTCANCGNANSPPISDAGADQTVFVAQAVTLDGSASSDPDGQALRYTWSFVSRPAGSSASLSSPSVVRPVFTPDREGDYVVQLVVNDGIVNSAPDTVRISTQNSAPVAHAGADRQTQIGVQVVLDGSASSDIDGDMLTYAWSVVTAPTGSAAQIVDPSKVLAKFTADLAGQYVIELVVDDGTVSSAPDSVVITTTQQNRVPTANAGADQSALVGETVHLDGSGSTDADGDALTFAWALNTRPANSAATLQGADSASPALNIDKPGTYVAQLIVSDGQAASAPDTIAISTTNSAPVASIDAPSTVKWGSTVTLDGTASSDLDGDALGFNWSMLSRPDGSDAALDDANATTSAFTADKPGVYVTQLVVNDGQTSSAPASATITATNSAPVANADSASTSFGSAVDINVLANDTDADGDALTIASVTQPAHGTAAINGTAVRYTPAAGFSGADAFAYTATDGAETASANVAIEVTAASNTSPIAQLQITPSTTDVGTAVTLSFAGSSDPDAGDHVAGYSVVLRSAPAASQGGGAGGTPFTLNVAQTTTNTSLSFVPDAPGVFAFELVAIDTHGAASTAVTAQLTATQPPPPNHAPTAVLQISPATVQLGSTPGTATLGFGNSSDPDAGDSIAEYVVTLVEAPAGSARGNSGGQTFAVGVPFATTLTTLTFAPDVAGTYRFRLTVRDTHGAESDAVTAQLIATAAEPPAGTVAKVTIDRTTVFLPGIGQSVTLHAQAFDETGAAVAGTATWSSSAPTQIPVDATGRVIASNIGSAQVFAEIGGVRSTPAFVVVAETLPNTLLVTDAQVLSVGGALGLAADEVPGVGTRYEVRLTGIAVAPAIGTIVLAAENAAVAGRVVATRAEGTVLVVTLELARLPELLGRYNIDWSIDLSPYPLVFDAPEAGANVMRGMISEALPSARTAALAGVLDAITCDGSVSAQLADFGATLGFDNQLQLQIQDFREDSALPPGFSRHVLTGSETISGTIEFKFNPGFSASGSCIAQGHINLPVFGWLSLLVTPSIRLGVGVDLSGQFTVAEGQLSITGRLGSSQSLGWSCAAGPNSCQSVRQFEPISDFKHTEIVPSLHDMHVTLTGHAYLLLGLDFAILQAEHAEILEAKVGPKQTVDLATEPDQAENESYASQYDLKIEGSLKPGSALQAALDALLGGDGVNVTFNLVFNQPLSKSPRGTFSASKTRIPFGESVDLNVRLDADSINYALIGYNVDRVELWRKKENEDEFTLFDTIGIQGSAQSTFTYRWEPTQEDIGKSKWAAFVRTTMPVPALEVSAKSVLELDVGCFSAGVQAAPQRRLASLQPQLDSQTDADNVCADVWTGTASARLEGIMAIESRVTWKRDPTFEPGPGQEGLVQYLPEGTVTVDNIQYRNMGCTVTPSEFTLSFDSPDPSDVNRLWVDYSTTPFTFVVGGNMRRLVQIACDDGFTAEAVEPIPWVNGSGNVSEDGRIIHGGSQSPQGATSFTFTHP